MLSGHVRTGGYARTRALHERTRTPAHRPQRLRPGVAAPAGVGVATALRPLLRRPRPVGPHERRHPLCLGRPDAAQHRPDLVPGRHGRPPRTPWPPPHAGRRPGRGPDRARGRPGMARRGPCPRRVDPRAPGGTRPRGHRAQHQPPHRPDPEPTGADVSPERLRPGPDDRRRIVPLLQSGGRHGRLAAGRRRTDPARRRRHRPVRLAQRAVRLPPPRPRRRPRRPPPGRDHRRARSVPGPGGRGALQGRQRLGAARVRDRVRRRGHPVPRHSPQAQGHAHRFARPAPGRHRTAPPRAS